MHNIIAGCIIYISMVTQYKTISITALLLCCIAAAGISCLPGTPGNPDVKIYTVPPPDASSGSQPQQASPPPQDNKGPEEEYHERFIVVDQKNNYFPIGLWAGYTEKTELQAGKPVDVWFGDVPETLQLEINCVPVQRSYRWETKIGIRTGITGLTYTMVNSTTEDHAYSLYILPSNTVNPVKVTVKQRFIPKK
jgi:hypothetical protein